MLCCEHHHSRAHRCQWSGTEDRRDKGLSTTTTVRPAEQSEPSGCKERSLEGLDRTLTEARLNDDLITEQESTETLYGLYCPGHTGVSGNERADRLARTEDMASGLQFGRAEVLRGLRNFLNMDRPGHSSIDRLKERGVEKGSVRHSTTLQGRERSVFNQTHIGTVWRATLGRLPRDREKLVWAFPSTTMPFKAGTETGWMNGWVDGWINGWVDIRVDGCQPKSHI